MLTLFTATIFIGAGMLFLVQPMIAKMLLPVLGGSPAVWNTCMVFFQAGLLAGYAWSHLSVRWLGVRRQAIVHAGLMALALTALPIALPATDPPAESSPIPWLLGALAWSVGLPFVMVSTGGPILQRWFASIGHRRSNDPYFLYAASNAGSLLALLAYPFLIEPALTLSQQRSLWGWGYAAFVVLVALCAGVVLRATRSRPMPPAAAHDAHIPDEGWTWPRRLLVIVLALVPSSLMLGATQYITTDVAAMPLLWTIPLALYLLTFIVAFASRRLVPARVLSWAVPIVVTALAVALLATGERLPVWAKMTLHLTALTVIGLMCHTRLADLRPRAERLTEFYLLVSVGGVLGGAFNALAAPVLFNQIIEYPIAIALACLLRVDGRTLRPQWASRAIGLVGPVAMLAVAALADRARAWPGHEDMGRIIAIAAPALALYLLLSWNRLGFALGFAAIAGFVMLDGGRATTLRERTFFGVHKINRYPEVIELVHSTTLHGLQFTAADRRGEPLGYYHRLGPLGDVFSMLEGSPLLRRVGMVGLGTGASAAYGQPGQTFVFHEIDPAIVRIVRSGEAFTYVNDAIARGVDVRIVLGDGRRTLQKVPDGHYGLIVLDAFSSDAIPIHLMTREATSLYLRKLKPGGLVAFHVSNQYMELAPVVARIAQDLGAAAVRKWDGAESSERWTTGRLTSEWVVVAHSMDDVAPLVRTRGWTPLFPDDTAPLWTDEFSSIRGVMTWW